MRKIKNVSFYIPLEIYNYDLFVVIGDNEYFKKALRNRYKKDLGGKMDKFMRELNVDKHHDRAGVHYTVEIMPVVGEVYLDSIIWLQEWGWNINDHSLLVHEVGHHCTAVFEDAHIKIESGDDEPFCYYSSFVYKKILQAFDKHVRKK
jgi:hypothetical protein